jgi:hypothetical protein
MKAFLKIEAATLRAEHHLDIFQHRLEKNIRRRAHWEKTKIELRLGSFTRDSDRKFFPRKEPGFTFRVIQIIAEGAVMVATGLPPGIAAEITAIKIKLVRKGRVQ